MPFYTETAVDRQYVIRFGVGSVKLCETYFVPIKSQPQVIVKTKIMNAAFYRCIAVSKTQKYI